MVEIQHLASRGKEPWRPRAKGDGGATCGCQVFGKPPQQSSAASGRQQSGKGEKGTTVIDEEAHGGTAMKTLYTSPSNMIWQKVKFGFGTPSMESGKAVLVSKKCIHGRPFGNGDGYCFYNLEVVQC